MQVIFVNLESNYDNHVMKSFEFESGRVLNDVNVEYSVTGVPKYDEDGNIVNAVIYFPTIVGGHSILSNFHDIIYDAHKDEYFFIKITSLGAPGSCSPSTTGLKYNFPDYTVKDRVNFKRQFLSEKFGKIKKVLGLIGEGTGGFEVYTWASEFPDEMEFIIVLNSTYQTYGHRYVLIKAVEAMIDSCDDFYVDGYSVSVSKLIVAIARLMFMTYFSERIFNELSNDEMDVLMEDYVDEILFMDIYDFKSRNQCLLMYDTYDKLSDIKAKSLIIGIEDYLSFNTKKDILPLKDILDNTKIIVVKGEESFYEEPDYSDVGLEVVSFLEQFN